DELGGDVRGTAADHEISGAAGSRTKNDFVRSAYVVDVQRACGKHITTGAAADAGRVAAESDGIGQTQRDYGAGAVLRDGAGRLRIADIQLAAGVGTGGHGELRIAGDGQRTCRRGAAAIAVAGARADIHSHAALPGIHDRVAAEHIGATATLG